MVFNYFLMRSIKLPSVLLVIIYCSYKNFIFMLFNHIIIFLISSNYYKRIITILKSLKSLSQSLIPELKDL
jgi:hypothetical protein